MARKRNASPRIELLRLHAGDPNTVDIRAGGRTLATLPRTRAEELGVREGAAWTPALARRVDRSAAESLAREAALAHLAKRSWSAAGLAARLVRGGHDEDAAAAAVAAMVADGWLDDRAYAQERVAHHRRTGSFPADALAALLARDGIGERDAERAARAGAASAKELRAEVRAAHRAGASARTVAGRLTRRGFDADTIRDALEAAGYELD
jgi:SOS response regulatory protein OraA/RecX